MEMLGQNVGDFAVFTCYPGYSMDNGLKRLSVECQSNQEWDMDSADCACKSG